MERWQGRNRGKAGLGEGQGIRRGFVLCLGWFLGWVLAACPSVQAQIAALANLSGTVVDPTHAVIPGAQVNLINEATAATSVVKSNQVGEFVFADVPPGNYRLSVTFAGFKVLSESGIHLDPGDSRSLREIMLQPGAASQIVSVSATNEGITLDSGTASTMISSEDIKHLSVEGRDVTELLKILPGFAISGGNNNVSNTAYDPSQVSVAGAYGSYSGQGTITNGVEVLYDGVDLTDPGAYGGTLQNINYDQVAEVKVQTSAITADQAYGPIVIDAAGKSGSNQFHGEVYTYGRTYQLDSTDWLANYDHQGKPTDYEIYPGLAIGGPVLIPHVDFNHNGHLTFFVGGEDYVQRDVYAYGNATSAILTALVPTAGMRTGDFSQSQINQYLGPLVSSSTYSNISSVPARGMDGSALTNGQLGANLNPTMEALLNTLPLPNLQTTSSEGYNWATTNLVNNDDWQGQGRVDEALNDRNHIFAMYSTERGKEGVPQIEYYSPRGNMGGTNTPGGGMLADLNSEMGTLNWTWIISSTLTNNVSVSGAYFDQDFVDKNFSALTLNGNWNFPGIFHNGSKTIPEFQDYGYDGLPVNLYPDTTFSGIYAKKWIRTGEDDATKVIGRHTLRTGIYIQLDNNHQVSPFVDSNGGIEMYYIGPTYNDTPSGTTAYSTGSASCGCGGNYLADFLEGGVFAYTQANTVPAPDVYDWTIDGYVQDHYRVTHYLSMDLGLRLNHLTPWTAANFGGIPVWEPASYGTTQNPSAPGFLWNSVDSSIPKSGLLARWAFVEPRVGFAWDMAHNGRSVLRGGAGIYTAHDSTNDIASPASAAMNQRTVTMDGPFLLADVPANAPAVSSVSTFTPTQNGYGFFPNDNHQPQVYTYNLMLDQEMPFHSMLQISYIGNVSRHLLNNGSTQPVTLDNINAIPIGGLFKPDPVTGEVYPEVCPTGSTTCTDVSGMSQQEVDDYRPYTQYDELEVASHNVNANYNSLQIVWNKTSKSLNYGINYTWSKALGVWGADGNGTPVTPFNYRDDYGPEAFDRRNIFNATYSYTMGNLFHQRFLGALVNQWMISGITTIQSGPDLLATNNPDFSLQGELDVSDGGNQGEIPVEAQDLLGTPDVYLMPAVTCDPYSHHGAQYINGGCYSLVSQLGVNGPYHQPDLYGPAYTDSDLALQKQFGLGGSRSLQVRYSAFNFLNHANRTYTSAVDPNAITLYETNLNQKSYQPISTALSDATNSNSSVFGQVPLRTGRRISEIQITFNF